MKFKIAILFIGLLSVVSVSGQRQPIYCDFEVSEDNIYTCYMSIYNSGGLTNITEIHGQHEFNKTHEDVRRVIIDVGESTNIPSVICERFTSLQYFIAPTKSINTLDHSFFECGNLISIDLSNNKIMSIPDRIFTTSRRTMKFINLSNNSLSNVARENFNQLYYLEELRLSLNAEITLANNSFEYLTNLRVLDLNSSNIQLTSSQLFRYNVELQSLSLSNGNIPTIPNGMFNNLTNLQTLHLSYSGITELSQNLFFGTENLRALYLNNNELSDIPSGIFSNISGLTTLFLNRNNLSDLSENLFEPLINLRVLSLNNCSISVWKQSWFRKLSQLRHLYLNTNNITEIPEQALESSHSLEDLHLDGNNITQIDSFSFGSLRNLRNFFARDNKIDAIDFHFLNQPERLNQVYLGGNKCFDLNLESFWMNSNAYLRNLTKCFDNYDYKVIVHTTVDEPYRWHAVRWTGLRVSVQGLENVRIALSDIGNVENGSSVEIFIGENNGRENLILENQVVVVENYERGLLSGNEMRTFEISWNFDVVLVYQLKWRFPFMTHKIKTSFPINFFGIRSELEPYWGGHVDWEVLRINGNFKQDDSICPESTTLI